MHNFRLDQIAKAVSIPILILLYYVYNNIWNTKSKGISTFDDTKSSEHPGIHNKYLRHILLWTHNYTEPFNRFKYGRKSFIDAGCGVNNCFVTNNRNYLSDITEWDAILFHAPEFTRVGNQWNHGYPHARSPEQIYIFACIESSANYPVCDAKFDGYFNWTMTYKLNSDIPWQYITVKDSKNTIVGPKENMKWENTTTNLSDELKKVLKRKTKAVGWFVSNCKALSKRFEYADKLKNKLKDIGLSLDIYGKCGNLKCEIKDQQACLRKLSDDYHFYLSFENSFSEDYVTEKFLTAVQNDVVPIVYGGADYTRFAANNSFIDANSYSPQSLAALIKQLMDDEDRYEEYFNWRQLYFYHAPEETYETHPFCKLCKALDDRKEKKIRKTYKDFRTWWNGKGSLKSVC